MYPTNLQKLLTSVLKTNGPYVFIERLISPKTMFDLNTNSKSTTKNPKCESAYVEGNCTLCGLQGDLVQDFLLFGNLLEQFKEDCSQEFYQSTILCSNCKSVVSRIKKLHAELETARDELNSLRIVVKSVLRMRGVEGIKTGTIMKSPFEEQEDAKSIVINEEIILSDHDMESQPNADSEKDTDCVTEQRGDIIMTRTHTNVAFLSNLRNRFLNNSVTTFRESRPPHGGTFFERNARSQIQGPFELQDTSSTATNSPCMENAELLNEYKCSICNLSFNRLSKLKFHIACHHTEPSFSDSDMLSEGLENESDADVLLESDESDSDLSCQVNSDMEIPASKATSMEDEAQGPSEFRNECPDKTLNKDKKTIPRRTGRPKECTQCSEKIHTASHFKEHNRVAHEGKNPTEYACLYCHEYFDLKDDLIGHNKTYHDPEGQRFECRKCPAFFSAPMPLRRHKERMHEFKSRICETCEILFRSKLMFECHKHKKDGKVFYKCLYCDRSSDVWVNVREHIKLIHKPQRKSVLCQHCGVGLNKRQVLSHERYCRSDFQTRKICNICNVSFKTVTEKVLHDRLQHSKKESFKCYFCNALFSIRCHLEVHLRQHTKEKVFKCKKCHKSYTTRNSLAKHFDVNCRQDEEKKQEALRKQREEMAKFRARKLYKCEKC